MRFLLGRLIHYGYDDGVRFPWYVDSAAGPFSGSRIRASPEGPPVMHEAVSMVNVAACMGPVWLASTNLSSMEFTQGPSSREFDFCNASDRANLWLQWRRSLILFAAQRSFCKSFTTRTRAFDKAELIRQVG
ncbi:hypothetical protein HY57_17245 [Dyella japonica A8]|uniref:Uncharacterized protein n=1 Tax=Dyella japonica A8 TaxID=1217721 RepID=A0A075K445_9GAMM|nr:hypothetical protein HY57_17245 [Dyella japonica A8]